jgi:hypothetical protein
MTLQRAVVAANDAKADFVKKIYETTVTEPVRNRVAAMKSMLEDIKNGRASQ